LIVWTLNGVYDLFLILIDILILVKNILFWFVHAVLWFLKLFVPPVIFIYKTAVYYLIRWPWWIYRLSFRNIGISINPGFFIITLWGIIPAIFLFLIFLGIGILMNYTAIGFIGAAFAILPLVWSYAEISSIRYDNRMDEGYASMRIKFGKGFEAVRSVLFYFILLLIFLISEVLLNLLGWIPQVGFTLIGISLNINTLISLFLLFIFVILLFSKFMMPPHVIHDAEHESSVQGSFRFLEVIGKKFIRYLFVHIPAAVFSALLFIIPAFIATIAIFMTLEMKNSVLDARISALNTSLRIVPEIEKFDIENQIERLEYFKNFPQIVFGDFTGLKERIEKRNSLEANIIAAESELRRNELLFIEDIDSLKSVIRIFSAGGDTIQNFRYERAKRSLESRQSDFSTFKIRSSLDIARLKSDLKNEKGMIAQLPIAFLLVIFWVSIFGGLALAVVFSYLGNIYHELYAFKEDGKVTYIQQVIHELGRRDRKQPLLGFTLIFIILFGFLLDWLFGWVQILLGLI
jgi:hypothetical protein